MYKVSPALTLVEKTVARALASLFGFTGQHAGGITQPGGSASNLTALVIARNSLHPEIKVNGCGSKRLVLFTSAHGHYSFEKAAQICGLGSAAARTVPVDAQGRMIPAELERSILKEQANGCTPFFVNATAGTTVLGSYDPLHDISLICKKYSLWMHVDASWGGPVIFSKTLKTKMKGSGFADSLTVNPHKMLVRTTNGTVPCAC